MMKKMILSLTCATFVCTAFATSCVTATQLSTDYATQTVAFKLTWTDCNAANNHFNKVWCFVDFRAAGSSSWTRAAIGGTPGVVNGTYAAGNTSGFYVTGANGQSATVTVKLDNAPDKFDWCAFVTDYPPNVTAAGGVYTFKGTPPFVLQPATGAAQTITQTTLATTALTVVPVAIMDATGCTGTFCPYSGSDLYIDATHVCRQRTGGAKNWEAWIKDARDGELYRIVYMSDNKWWLAQNVKYAGAGYAISGCTKDECGRSYTDAEVHGAWGGTSGLGANVQGVCPGGWVLPVNNDWSSLVASIGDAATVAARLRSLDAACTPRTDWYGWASKVRTFLNNSYMQVSSNKQRESFYSNEGANNWLRFYGLGIDQYQCGAVCTLPRCDAIIYAIQGGNTSYPILYSVVRCLRVL